MDPNIPVQPIQPVMSEVQTPVTPTILSSPNVPPSKTRYILLGVIILLIIAAVGGGTYYLGVVKHQINKNLKTTATITPSPTPSSNPTANWKAYENKEIGISFKYPPEWKMVNSSSTDINLYPPSSVIGLPSPMIDIYSTSAAYETLEQPPMSSISSALIDNIVGWQSEDQGPLPPHIYEVALPNKTGSLFMSTDDSLEMILKEILSTFKFTEQTSQTDPTATWKTLDTGQISIKYPPEWAYKYMPEDGQHQIYNPNIMENVGTNGGTGNQHAYVSLPKEYVFVNSITTSTKTAIQEAQDYKQQTINLNEDSTILGSKTVNGFNFALYTDQGEASRYNDLAVSNGKVLVKINTSMKSLDGKDIENQIINTLKFTQ